MNCRKKPGFSGIRTRDPGITSPMDYNWANTVKTKYVSVNLDDVF